MADRVLAVLLLLLAAGYGSIALVLHAPFQYDPLGPETWPQLLALALLIGAVALFRRPDPAPNWGGKATLGRIAAAIIGLTVYALLFEELGFILSTTLFCLVTTLGNGVRPIPALSFSLGIGVLGYLLCTRLLELNLPAGLLPL